MKLKSSFITHNSGDEQLMISVGGDFSGMVRSNSTAAFIINLLKEDITTEEIVEKILAEYNAERSMVEKDVERVIASLRSIGAIDE